MKMNQSELTKKHPFKPSYLRRTKIKVILKVQQIYKNTPLTFVEMESFGYRTQRSLKRLKLAVLTLSKTGLYCEEHLVKKLTSSSSIE